MQVLELGVTRAVPHAFIAEVRQRHAQPTQHLDALLLACRLQKGAPR